MGEGGGGGGLAAACAGFLSNLAPYTPPPTTPRPASHSSALLPTQIGQPAAAAGTFEVVEDGGGVCWLMKWHYFGLNPPHRIVMGFRSVYLSWGACCEYSGPKDFTLPPLVACPLFC